MSPRRKKASDEEVFAAAMRAMARLGPGELTLNEIAAEAGLTAGALVQRFGSKRELQVRMAERLSHSTGDMFARLAASAGSPLDALYAYADGMAAMGPTPDAMARSFAWLLQDLTDPDLRAFTLAHVRATRAELRRFVEAAIAAGQLRQDADPAAVARAIDTAVGGSLIAWAFFRDGRAADWVRHDVDAVLVPWLRPQKTTRRSRAPRRPGGGSRPARRRGRSGQ